MLAGLFNWLPLTKRSGPTHPANSNAATIVLLPARREYGESTDNGLQTRNMSSQDSLRNIIKDRTKPELLCASIYSSVVVS